MEFRRRECKEPGIFTSSIVVERGRNQDTVEQHDPGSQSSGECGNILIIQERIYSYKMVRIAGVLKIWMYSFSFDYVYASRKP